MKKIILLIILAIVIIPMLFGVYLWTHRSSVLASKIESALHVPVSVGDIEVSSTQIVIRDLRVSNYAGSLIEDAIYTKSIVIDFELGRIFANPSHINSIHIQDPVIGIEMYDPTGKKNNWQRILSKQEGSSSESLHKYTIKKLSVTNTRVRAYNPALGDDVLEPKPIPYFELRDISSDKPVDLSAIIKIIARAILNEAGGLPGLANILKEAPGKVIDKALQPVKTIENTGKDLKNEAKKLFDRL